MNQWFNIIINSTDVLISDLDLEAKSLNGVKIANSDGWDTYRSDRIVIQNSVIDNTDGKCPLDKVLFTFSQQQIVCLSSQIVQMWLFRTSCAMALTASVLAPWASIRVKPTSWRIFTSTTFPCPTPAMVLESRCGLALRLPSRVC